jgi:hypothetical protein
MFDIGGVTSVLELIYYLSVVLGVPIGLYQYIQAKRREREDREHRVFDAVSASYLEFQQLCLDHPYLDVFDIPDEHPVELTPLQAKEELVAFSVLFSIFERAYLLYADHPTRITEGQWKGWHSHICGYFRRANFQRAWNQGASSYDPRFNAYMLKVERQLRPVVVTDA